MQKIKTIGLQCLSFAALLGVLYFGFRSLSVQIWISPVDIETYSSSNSSESSMTIVIMPENKAYIIYSEVEPPYEEIMLTNMRGTYGKRYFRNLWNIGIPNRGLLTTITSFRIYPKEVKPVAMEVRVLNRLIDRVEKSSDLGMFETVVLFSENAIQFDGIWLKKL